MKMFSNTKNKTCPVCQIYSYIDVANLSNREFATMSNEELEQFKIDYLGYDFDPELKQKRIEFDERRNQILKEKYDKIEVKPKITCPYCQSADTKKISGTSRWLSTGLFGLASNKIGKNYHCNKCKSDF